MSWENVLALLLPFWGPRLESATLAQYDQWIIPEQRALKCQGVHWGPPPCRHAPRLLSYLPKLSPLRIFKESTALIALSGLRSLENKMTIAMQVQGPARPRSG